jgi:hypothetical protein
VVELTYFVILFLLIRTFHLVALLIRIFHLDPALVVCMVLPWVGLIFLAVMIMSVDRGAWLPGGPASGYPSYLMTIPIRTSTLVFWPMLYGALSMIVAWYAFSWLVAVPQGWSLPAYWPPLLMVALCAWLQVICWAPFANPLAKMLPLMLVSIGMVLFGPSYAFRVAETHALSSASIAIIYLVLILLAYPAALAGLSMARRGDVLGWSGSGRASRVVDAATAALFRTALPRRPFKSADDAQAWFEWSGEAFEKTILMIFGCVYVTALLAYWIGQLAFPLEASSADSAIGIRLTSMWVVFANPSWYRFWVFAPILLFFAALWAGGRHHTSIPQSFSRFFAVRPLSNISIVAAKLRLAARAAVRAIPFAFVLLLLSAKYGAATGPLGLLLAEYAGPLILARILLSGLAVVYLLWKFSADYLFLGLPEKPYFSALLIFLEFMIALACYFGVTSVPSVLHSPEQLALSSIVAVLAFIKLAVLIVIARALLRRGLIDAAQLRRMLIPWCCAAIAVSAAAVLVVPANLVVPWGVAAAVVLLMPGVRIALAPLTLEWSRHQ